MTDHHQIQNLAGLDHWQLEDSDQDLRGRMLKTPDGKNVGEVDDMLADIDSERIAALRLVDGRVVNINSVDLHDDGNPVLLVDTDTVPPAPSGVAREDLTSEHVPIVEEQMIVGKRRVELGKVRINTRVVSKEVGEDVSLSEEHVSVDRRAVNERISADDADTLFKDGTIEMTETGERPIVTKEAVVTGEVVVGKDVDTRKERVTGTVRHTEVDVDRDAPRKR